MADVKENFRQQNKAIEDPVSVSITSPNEIQIKGTSINDAKLFQGAHWHINIFGGASVQNSEIKISAMESDPEKMLHGYTSNELSPGSIDNMYASGVIDCIKRGNKYVLTFVDKRTRDKALKDKYVHVAGTIVRVESWSNSVNVKQCFRCWKTNHVAKVYRRKTQMCKYCAKDDGHSEEMCTYKYKYVSHRCANC